MDRDADDAGGEAACWLNQVCPDCGRLNATIRPLTCEACGAAMPAALADHPDGR